MYLTLTAQKNAAHQIECDKIVNMERANAKQSIIKLTQDYDANLKYMLQNAEKIASNALYNMADRIHKSLKTQILRCDSLKQKIFNIISHLSKKNARNSTVFKQEEFSIHEIYHKKYLIDTISQMAKSSKDFQEALYNLSNSFGDSIQTLPVKKEPIIRYDY